MGMMNSINRQVRIEICMLCFVEENADFACHYKAVGDDRLLPQNYKLDWAMGLQEGD